MRPHVPVSFALVSLAVGCRGTAVLLPNHTLTDAERTDAYGPPPECPGTDAPAITPPFRVLPAASLCLASEVEGAILVHSADALVPCPQQEAVSTDVDFRTQDVVVFTHWDTGGGGPDDPLVAMLQEGDLLTAVYNHRSWCGGAHPFEGSVSLAVVVPKGTIKRARTALCPGDPCDRGGPSLP